MAEHIHATVTMAAAYLELQAMIMASFLYRLLLLLTLLLGRLNCCHRLDRIHHHGNTASIDWPCKLWDGPAASQSKHAS